MLFTLTKGEILSMIEALSDPKIVDTFNTWETDFFGKLVGYACSNQFRALTEKQEGSLIAIYATHIIKPRFVQSKKGAAYLAKAKAEIEKKKTQKAPPSNKTSTPPTDDEPPF